MNKYMDMLMNDEPETPASKPQRDYMQMVMSDDDDVQEEYTPTGATDARTAKPVMKWTPDAEDQADFGALFKSGWVDKPESKIQIFAASRFPNLPKAEREARYKSKDGKILFKGDDGKYHSEVRGDFLSKLRGGAGTSIAALPAGVLGAAGSAVGGLLGAGIGSGLGEGIRKGVGNLVFGEEQSSPQIIADIVKEAAMGLGGDVVGRSLVGFKNKSLLSPGKNLKTLVQDDIRRGLITPADHAKAELVKQLAEQHGVELAPHQLYNKQGMINIWGYLRRHPQTADAIQAFDKKVSDQIEGAVTNLADGIAPAKDIATVGSNLRAASQKVVKDSTATRTRAVSPMYKKAFDDTPDVDISKPLAEIDELIAKAPDNSSALPVFQKVKNFFLNEDGTPITNLEKINWAKKDVDQYLKNYNDPDLSSLSKDKLRTIQAIKDKILTEVDIQSPEYAKARKAYQALTPRVQQIEDSVIGRLSRMEGDTGLVGATGQLFDTHMSPKLVAEAKAMLQTRDPALWDQAVATHIRHTWQTLPETQSADLVNAAGKMHKKLFGTELQREKMKIAMGPEQFKNFDGLMTVFERAAKGHEVQSATASNLVIDEQLSKGLSTTAEKLAQKPILTTVREGIFDKWNNVVLNGNQSKLLDAMLDSQATRQIAKMRTLSPGSEKQIRSLSVFTTWLFERAFAADLHRTQGPTGALPQ